MRPKFFKDQWDFRKWLEENHLRKKELIVGFYKVNSGKKSMSWSESVDQALCFGWIDGVRKSIDELSYQIRFTPRRSGSIWSDVNINKIADLTKKGLMHQSGIAAFKKRTAEKSAIYSHEIDTSVLSAEYEDLFREKKTAWKYFQSLAPSYKKLSVNWIMNAKQETTRLKRLNTIITDSQNNFNRWKDNVYKKK